MQDKLGDIDDLIGTQTAGDENPEIRFGADWIPAHHAWKKMETASAVADAIEHFNENFPHLATSLTRSVVPEVRQRLKDVQVRTPKRKAGKDFSSIALELLKTMGPEDVLDRLEQEHKEKTDLRGLIQLVGDIPYLEALKREAEEFVANKILPDQTSQIWNEMARPAPGGGLWSGRKIDLLLSGKLLQRSAQ